jgi:hypothetical protein
VIDSYRLDGRSRPALRPFGLEVEPPNWRDGSQDCENLNGTYRQAESRSAGNPSHRMPSYKGKLTSHEKLPHVGRASFVGLSRGAEHNEMTDDNGKGEHRHDRGHPSAEALD